MNLQQMIDAINRRVDDVVDSKDAAEWLNSGKNQMAIAVGAKFPDLDSSNLSGTFVFDDQFHEAPVLYACASFKEQDSALSEVGNFMTKFENLKKEFVRSYVVPPRYRNDRLSQQFIATAGQTSFIVTKDGYDPAMGDAKVYVNDQLVSSSIGTGNELILTVAASLNDCVTVVWEEHTDLIDPPFNWWTW
jgi:hypothetical protein